MKYHIGTNIVFEDKLFAIKEEVEIADKKCYFETRFGIRRIDEITE